MKTISTCYNKNVLFNNTRYHLTRQLLHTSSNKKGITRGINQHSKDEFFPSKPHMIINSYKQKHTHYLLALNSPRKKYKAHLIERTIKETGLWWRKYVSHKKCNGISGCSTSLPRHYEVTKPLVILAKN